MRKIFLLLLFVIAICFTQASTRYVKPIATGSGDGSSWLNACDSLQRMINASSAGDAIWVAAGTYKPTNTNDPNISFAMKTGVAIYGGFTGTESLLNQRNYNANPTILSGDLRGNDLIVAGIIANNGENSYHIIKNTIVNSTAVLDGFTLQGGNANSTNGGAIYNGPAAVPTISHCKFLYNMAAVSTGGAVYQYAVGAAFSDCVFTNNSANDGGAFSLENNATATFANCVFDHNSAASTGGALRVGQNTTATFSSCSFNSNTSSILGGAVYFNSSTFVFTGCNFTSNSANGDNGGAVYIQHAIIEGDFRSCNFTSNLSVGHGGAIYGEGAELNINNSHFDGNVAQGSGTLGGAICNKYNGVDYSALFLKVCSFTNNTSDGSGGAVYTDGGDFSADNCIFIIILPQLMVGR